MVGLIILCLSLLGYTGTIDLSIENLKIYEEDGYTKVIHTECNSSINLQGAPLLPAHKVKILILQDMEVDEIEIINSQYEEIELPSTIYPCQSLDTSGGFTTPDFEYYSLLYPFPQSLIYPISRTGYTMGFNIATLKIYPFQYISYAKKVRFYYHIEFSVTYRPSQVEHLRPQRRSEIAKKLVEETIKGIVLNPQDVEIYSPSIQIESRKSGDKVSIASYPSLEGNCVDYVIITNEALRDSFERLAEYRTKSGLLSHVMTIESIDTLYTGADIEEKIRNFLRDANIYWGTIFILLGGDVNIVPVRIVPGLSAIGKEIPTDLYYSGLDGTWNDDRDWIYGEDIPLCIWIEQQILSLLDFWFIDDMKGFYAQRGYIYKTTTGGNS